MSNLKPCPFCGSEKISIYITWRGKEEFYPKASIFCEECHGGTGEMTIPQKGGTIGIVIKEKYALQLFESWNRRKYTEGNQMRIKVTEIEADAKELRESNTLAQNLANMLSRCFQNTEPLDDEEPEEEE